MPRVDKKTREAQLNHVWRMLLANKTQEEIAQELGVSTKTIQRMSLELDKRYGEIQRQKTNDTIYVECNLFKNRMLKLYGILERKAESSATSGMETAKCAEVAANISIDILKMESESIKSIRDLNVPLSDHDKANRLLYDSSNKKSEQQQQQQQQQNKDDNNNNNNNNNNIDKRDVVPGRLDDSEETC